MKKLTLPLAAALLLLLMGTAAIRGDAAEMSATENNIYEVIVTSNLRLSPSVEGQWLTTVPEGSVVIRLGEDVSGYSLIDYEGQKGYIYTGCIRVADQAAARVILDEVEDHRTQAVEEITAQRMTRGSRDQDESYRISDTMTTLMVMAQAAPRSEREERSGRASSRTAVAAIAQLGTRTQQTVQGTAREAATGGASVAETAAAPAATEVQQLTRTQGTQTQEISDQISMRTNLRQTPGAESDLLAAIPRGASVTVLGRSGGYAMVQYDGMTGYVLDDFVVNSVDFNRVGSQPVLFTVTAYCPCRICCGVYSPEVTGGVAHTSTGTIPEAGRTIAVDPSVIPYGTRVMIEGLGTYVAEDCGGLVKDNHIDVYFDTHEEAVAFGRQRLYVTIQR